MSWEAINFENRIRPAIPLHIVQGLREDERYEELMEEVLDSHS